jgi:quinol monooxygenase YgiN
MAKRKPKKAPRKHNKPKSHLRKSRKATGTKLPKGAVTLIVLMRAREGQETLLGAELRALVGPTRKEAGCLSYDLHQSSDAPGGFLLHEIWASREAHTQHTKTPHFLRWDAGKDALLTSRDATFWKQIA